MADGISVILGVTVQMTCLSSVVWFYYLLRNTVNYSKPPDGNSDENYKNEHNKWSSLFEEFKETEVSAVKWFYYWFIIRRLIYTLNLLFLIEFPIA